MVITIKTHLSLTMESKCRNKKHQCAKPLTTTTCSCSEVQILRRRMKCISLNEMKWNFFHLLRFIFHRIWADEMKWNEMKWNHFIRWKKSFHPNFIGWNETTPLRITMNARLAKLLFCEFSHIFQALHVSHFEMLGAMNWTPANAASRAKSKGRCAPTGVRCPAARRGGRHT